MEDLQALVAANEDAAAAIAAAYEVLLGGVPNIAGFEFLIENAIATNYGSNNPAIEFNQENIFINIANALVQGNPDAAASFAALTAGQASLSDKVAAIYNAIVPLAAQSEGGLAYVTRPDALAFYAAVAAERGVAGADGAAIVALASILNIAYENDLGGIGDAVNDLLAAIADGSAQLPADGDTFTPIEVADGTNYDGDDIDPNTVTLTVHADTVSGSTFNAPRDFTPGGTDQMNTLNDDDVLTGTGAYNVLNFTFVNDADTSDKDINPTLNNIQEINVNARLDDDGYLDLQDTTGVQEINFSGIDGYLLEAYNIQDATGGDGAGIRLSVNNSNDEWSHAHFYFVDKAVKGDADIANLTLNNVTLTHIYVQGQNTQGFETLNLESTGDANTVGYIEAEELQTLTITGDTDLTLGERYTIVRGSGQIEAYAYGAGLWNVAGSLTTIDASGLAAALDIAVGDETVANLDGTSGTKVDIAITGTAFDDTIRLLSGLDTVADTIDGGEGDDTIQVFNSVTKGSISAVENLDIRGGHNGVSAITVDASIFTGLESITIRNEGSFGNFVAPVALTTTLTKLTAEQAAAITVQHSTTLSNGLGQNVIVASLATDTASDTVGLTIVDQADDEDRGINIDPRFNATLTASKVENLVFNDEDSESNSVLVTSLADVKGSITVLGENQAGNFFNLNSTANILQLDQSGSAVDGTSISDPGNGAADRFSGEKIDASAYTGDLIVRVSNNAALANGAQTILGGSGDDHIVFDALSNTTAGLTISDKVDGGEGFDTLYVDGDGKLINISASEWTNVSNIEAIHLVGQNLGGTNLASAPGKNDAYGKNSYNLTLTNDLIAKNGEVVTGGRVIHIINDNDTLNGVGVADDPLAATNYGVTIDARSLNAQSSFTYDGEESQVGAGETADRFIMSDANVNGLAVIDGGAILGAANAASNLANSDVLEVRNSAVVTIGDLVGVSNVGTIEFTNDQAATQAVYLELDNATVDRLVNSTLAASALGVETLTISAFDNPLIAGAHTILTIDASQVTSDFLVLDITGGYGADTIISGAGNDIIRGGRGADALDGGNGSDVFHFAQGDSNANNNAGAAYDTLTGFLIGTDDFNFDGIGLPSSVVAAVAGVTLAQLIDFFEGVNGGGWGGAGRAIAYTTTDGFTLLAVDSDGDDVIDTANGAGDDVFVAMVGNYSGLTINDFVA